MIDADARHSIEHELERNFLVEASAGSGKTHSLARRIVNGIVSGAYPVDRIAAVTFTRKAAAELSTRIRLGLEQAGATAALDDFESMFVGTVHAFCARILRQHPLEAGVSPSFREFSEADDQRLRARVLRTTLEGHELVRLLAHHDASAVDLWPALTRIAENGELDYPAPMLDAPPPVWNQLDAFCDFLERQLVPCEDRAPTCKLLQAVQATLRLRRDADRFRLQDQLRVLQLWENEPSVVQRYWGAKRAEQKARLAVVQAEAAEFRALAVATLTQLRAQLYGQCVEVLCRVRTECDRQRKSSGYLNFSDLLRHSLALLQNCPAVREHLGDRYRHLLVDEFQDTDPLQAELFELLAGTQPRAGGLFLVGDPKQSIYRFRRADPSVLEHFRGRLDKLTLSTSFRCQPALCDWLNQTFARLLPGSGALTSAGSQRVDPAVFRLTTSCERYADASRHEAERIADCIQADGRWADFLILTARNAEVKVYQRALEARGIACETVGARTPLSSRGDSLMPLLRHLADPQDNVNLVGLLRGPLFGHSDEELFQHVQAAGTLRPSTVTTRRTVLERPKGFDEKGLPTVLATLAKLDDWRLHVRFLPLGASIAYLLEQSGLMALALSESAEGVAELRGIVQAMRQSGEAGMTLPQAVAELVERNSVERTSSTCGQRNAVRVMNVHKAKGLEARVVFLAAPTSGFALAADHVVSERRGYLCLRRNRKPLAHPLHWDELERYELDCLRAEQVRFLYVAATRARQRLVIGHWSGTHASAGRPWGELVHDLPELPVAPIDAVAPVWPCSSPEDYALWQQRRAARCVPSWSRGSVRLGKGGPRLKPTLPPDPVRIDAQDWGHLLHKLLEHLVRDPSLDRSGLERLGRWTAFGSADMLEALPTPWTHSSKSARPCSGSGSTPASSAWSKFRLAPSTARASSPA